MAGSLEDLVAEASKDAEPAGDRPRGADDASVDRLLAETDHALGENEGTRRRSAIAHLKAAVAAVRADGNKDRETRDAETARTLDKFREDLAKVVQPGDAEAETASDGESDGDTEVASELGDAAEAITDDSPLEDHEEVARAPEAATERDSDSQVTPAPAPTKVERPASDRPGTERPKRAMPPLMLVSEQRIDQDAQDTPAQPVQPRRIQASDPDEGTVTTEGSTDEFRAFAVKMKAEGLQEELEASLAYGLFVEGAEFNSRPKIMARVLRLHDDGSVSREDGLRAFGVLLREGRIQRARRGEFILPETRRFHPDANAQANSA
ncbi:MAG: hypothetical protein AAF762_04215 [Pseudomonadota bacterium]